MDIVIPMVLGGIIGLSTGLLIECIFFVVVDRRNQKKYKQEIKEIIDRFDAFVQKKVI